MKLLRTGLETLSRGIVLKRSLPARFGSRRIIVTPESALRYWKLRLDSVDPKLLSLAEELVRPADVIWDIGANVGLFAFAAASLAGPNGRVLAVEPDAWLTTLLHRSASLRNPSCAHTDVLSIAISDKIDCVNLNIASRGRCSNFLTGGGNSQSGGSRRTQSTLSVTLDWLLKVYPPPNVLKIDVEGLEEAVLMGATKLLKEERPIILCEVSEQNRMKVTQLLAANNYTLFDADIPENLRHPLTMTVWNTVAFPK